MSDYTVTKDGIIFCITFKKMKNLRMKLSHDGTVAVSVPYGTSKERIDKFLRDGIGWVKEQKEIFAKKHPDMPQSPDELPKFIYHLGQKLPIVYYPAKDRYVRLTDTALEVHCADMPEREVLVHAIKEVQRKVFLRILPSLCVECEKAARISPLEWRIRTMKTKWGTCNRTEKRIWLRLELISYPRDCIKAVMIHELTHLHEAGHTKRFYQLMDEFFPGNKEPNRILDEGRYDWW